MSKAKKILTALLAACLILGGLWLYWKRESSVESWLGQEEWYKIQMHGVYFKEYTEYTIGDDAAVQILAALGTVRVDRGPKFRTLDGDALLLWLYPGGKAPTQVTIREDGRVSVMAELRDAHISYYEGGEDLYRCLQDLAGTLPATNLIPE